MRLRDYLVRAADAAMTEALARGDAAPVVDAILDELISRVPSADWSDAAEDWLRDVKNGQRW